MEHVKENLEVWGTLAFVFLLAGMCCTVGAKITAILGGCMNGREK